MKRQSLEPSIRRYPAKACISEYWRQRSSFSFPRCRMCWRHSAQRSYSKTVFTIPSSLNALTSDAMTLALPIIAALPFTSSFIDDIKSGFVKEYLPPHDKNRLSSRENSRQHCFGWTCGFPRRAAGVCGCRACFLPHGSSVGTWRGFPALF